MCGLNVAAASAFCVPAVLHAYGIVQVVDVQSVRGYCNGFNAVQLRDGSFIIL